MSGEVRADLIAFTSAAQDLVSRALAGLAAIKQIAEEGLPVDVALEEAPAAPFNDTPLFTAIRSMLPGRAITPEQFRLLKAAIEAGFKPADAAVLVGLNAADFEWAASVLGWSVPQVRAVDIVEAAGSGWFTDIRADILALDGPGGFIDGSALPKILYEAHVFARNCEPKGRFNKSHPNLSSAGWNRALYVGGQGEYERLWRAMALDREAAFRAVSVGRYQILGENYRLAGFGSAEQFFLAMQKSERAHLEAFVQFIIASGLVDEGRQISSDPASCRPFALGYNGPQADKNRYPQKIADAFKAAAKGGAA